MSDTLQQELAKFANETGRTILEWIELWNNDQIDKTDPGVAELHARAVELAGQLP